MTKLCAITGCESKWSQQNDPDSIPMFNLPKNNDLENVSSSWATNCLKFY